MNRWTPGPWGATWGALDGYDCMSGAYLIRANAPREGCGTRQNAIVAELDEQHYTPHRWPAGADEDKVRRDLLRELDANARLVEAAPALVQAIEDLLAEFWTGRKPDVRKQFHAMVAENGARKLLHKIREGEE